MGESEKVLREVAQGLDGLVMLVQWELSLATDLRKKVGALLGEKGGKGEEGGRGRPQDRDKPAGTGG
jgi:hypothetical protein